MFEIKNEQEAISSLSSYLDDLDSSLHIYSQTKPNLFY